MMLPNLPLMGKIRINKRVVLTILVIGVVGAVVSLPIFRGIEQLRELRTLAAQLEQQNNYENCVGTYDTNPCLEYRMAKRVIGQEYGVKLAALRKKREEAEGAQNEPAN